MNEEKECNCLLFLLHLSLFRLHYFMIKEIPNLSSLPSIAFNLGGRYNSLGQKCAAAEIYPGLVYFVDIARGLDYFFYCDFSIPAIRQAYLHNNSVFVPYMEGQMQLRIELERLAETAPAICVDGRSY
jgi:hypothetical protein